MAFDTEITEKSRDLLALERARERIARGWCQKLTDKHDNVCAVGALKAATGGLWGWEPGQLAEVARLLRVMGFTIPEDHDTADALMWNDRAGRTQAEVLARFDAAIARLAEG